MYADRITDSIQKCLNTTNARREKQQAYNKEHNITPRTAKRENIENLNETFGVHENNPDQINQFQNLSKEEQIKILQFEMKKAAAEMRFDEAAALREQIKKILA
jgi:excinuclease ABC subunit B